MCDEKFTADSTCVTFSLVVVARLNVNCLSLAFHNDKRGLAIGFGFGRRVNNNVGLRTAAAMLGLLLLGHLIKGVAVVSPEMQDKTPAGHVPPAWL